MDDDLWSASEQIDIPIKFKDIVPATKAEPDFWGDEPELDTSKKRIEPSKARPNESDQPIEAIAIKTEEKKVKKPISKVKLDEKTGKSVTEKSSTLINEKTEQSDDQIGDIWGETVKSTNEPKGKPKSNTDKLTDKVKGKPKDKLTYKVTKTSPSTDQIDDIWDEIIELNDETTAKPMSSTDKLTDKVKGNPTDLPIDTAKKATFSPDQIDNIWGEMVESKDEPNTKVKANTDMLTDKSTSKPTEKLSEKLTDTSKIETDKPTVKTAKSKDKPTENVTEKETEKPTESPSEKPVDEQKDKPASQTSAQTSFRRNFVASIVKPDTPSAQIQDVMSYIDTIDDIWGDTPDESVRPLWKPRNDKPEIDRPKTDKKTADEPITPSDKPKVDQKKVTIPIIKTPSAKETDAIDNIWSAEPAEVLPVAKKRHQEQLEKIPERKTKTVNKIEVKPDAIVSVSPKDDNLDNVNPVDAKTKESNKCKPSADDISVPVANDRSEPTLPSSIKKTTLKKAGPSNKIETPAVKTKTNSPEADDDIWGNVDDDLPPPVRASKKSINDDEDNYVWGIDEVHYYTKITLINIYSYTQS